MLGAKSWDWNYGGRFQYNPGPTTPWTPPSPPDEQSFYYGYDEGKNLLGYDPWEHFRSTLRTDWRNSYPSKPINHWNDVIDEQTRNSGLWTDFNQLPFENLPSPSYSNDEKFEYLRCPPWVDDDLSASSYFSAEDVPINFLTPPESVHDFSTNERRHYGDTGKLGKTRADTWKKWRSSPSAVSEASPFRPRYNESTAAFEKFSTKVTSSRSARGMKRGPEQNHSYYTLQPTRGSNKKRRLEPEEPYNSFGRIQKRTKRFRAELDPETAEENLERFLEDQNASYCQSLADVIWERQIRWYERTPHSNRKFNIGRGSSKYDRECEDRPNRKFLTGKRRMHHPTRSFGETRPIVIDGCNVAYAFGEVAWGRRRTFDCEGIQVCVDYFVERGFDDITVVIPQAKLEDEKMLNKHVLRKLGKQGRLFSSFSRLLPNGKWVSSYDDRLILDLALKSDAVIISNDRFKDLWNENRNWRQLIVNRVLSFRFVCSKESAEIIFPCDPFGRNGKSLDEFLHFPRSSQWA